MRYVFHSHYMFHSIYLFYLYVYMKMAEIPSLYELACRAYSDTDIPGYQEAFQQAITRGEKPSLILLRINSLVEEIPYRDGMIPNPFA